MKRLTVSAIVLTLAAATWLVPQAAFAAAAPPPPPADGPVGYGGAKVQLAPIMSPYRTPSGVHYQVVTLRMVLDVGLNERPSCFMIPVVHEKILLYLNRVKPQPADLMGQRKDVFLKEILDVATSVTSRGFYAGVELVDDTSPALDPKSQTLSTQCR